MADQKECIEIKRQSHNNDNDNNDDGNIGFLYSALSDFTLLVL